MGWPPTRRVGLSGVINSGMRRLQFLQFLEEQIELLIGDFGPILDVVAIIVMIEEAA